MAMHAAIPRPQAVDLRAAAQPDIVLDDQVQVDDAEPLRVHLVVLIELLCAANAMRLGLGNEKNVPLIVRGNECDQLTAYRFEQSRYFLAVDDDRPRIVNEVRTGTGTEKNRPTQRNARQEAS